MAKRNFPFTGKKVYYSGSISGVPEPDPEFAWKLVRYMIDNGADVLSERVAARGNIQSRIYRYERRMSLLCINQSRADSLELFRKLVEFLFILFIKEVKNK